MSGERSVARGAGSERGERLRLCSLNIVMVTTSPPSSSPCPGLAGHTTVPATSNLQSPCLLLHAAKINVRLELWLELWLEQFKGFWVTQNGGDNWVTSSLLF